MLIFFIHGVAERNADYAESLQSLIKQELKRRNKPLPNFLASFWGDLSRIGKIWNDVDSDLAIAKEQYVSINPEELFRYRTFREQFISKFMGDFFTYFSPKWGINIRKKLAQQLYDFIEDNPGDRELHIISHSLGTVILWDILFSTRFGKNDPAWHVRAMLQGWETRPDIDIKKEFLDAVKLESTVTMGSPILLMNPMLDISPTQVHQVIDFYRESPLRWVNIIHASDIIAYPLKSSLNLKPDTPLIFRDDYIWEDANLVEKAIRSMGQADVAMAAGSGEAHNAYWNNEKVARFIVENIVGDRISSEQRMCDAVATRLSEIPGMTSDRNPDNITASQVYLKFRDGSGTLHLFVNSVKVHHIYVLNEKDQCRFGGYVGWIHTQDLLRTLDAIKSTFGDRTESD